MGILAGICVLRVTRTLLLAFAIHAPLAFFLAVRGKLKSAFLSPLMCTGVYWMPSSLFDALGQNIGFQYFAALLLTKLAVGGGSRSILRLVFCRGARSLVGVTPLFPSRYH